MEKLFKRADGYCEASDGDFAIFPERRSGVDGDNFFFTFKPSFNSQSIRVEWPTDSAIAIIPSETAITMIRLNHARNLSKEEVDQFNASIDFEDGDKKEPDPVKDETPADEKPAQVQADETENNEPDTDVVEEGDQEEGEEKSKRGRKKKEAETVKQPLSIPGLTS